MITRQRAAGVEDGGACVCVTVGCVGCVGCVELAGGLFRGRGRNVAVNGGPRRMWSEVEALGRDFSEKWMIGGCDDVDYCTSLAKNQLSQVRQCVCTPKFTQHNGPFVPIGDGVSVRLLHLFATLPIKHGEVVVAGEAVETQWVVVVEQAPKPLARLPQHLARTLADVP